MTYVRPSDHSQGTVSLADVTGQDDIRVVCGWCDGERGDEDRSCGGCGGTGEGPPISCWFHGLEPIPDDVYRVCLECGHAWMREALEAAHHELGDDPDAEPTPAERIWSCPLCIHDF